VEDRRQKSFGQDYRMKRIQTVKTTLVSTVSILFIL